MGYQRRVHGNKRQNIAVLNDMNAAWSLILAVVVVVAVGVYPAVAQSTCDACVGTGEEGKYWCEGVPACYTSLDSCVDACNAVADICTSSPVGCNSVESSSGSTGVVMAAVLGALLITVLVGIVFFVSKSRSFRRQEMSRYDLEVVEM